MSKHIPRRSGVGARMVLPPAEPKMRLRRYAGAAPATCGALNPERPGIVDDATGEQLTDPVYCTASAALNLVTGDVIVHRGKHRARLLDGIVVRWDGVPA